MNSSVDAPLKTFGFGIRAFKRFYELIPLVVCVSAACVGGAGMCIYSLYQKPDVKLNRTNTVVPWEVVDPTKSQKLLTYRQQYVKNDELESLRKEIGSYKY